MDDSAFLSREDVQRLTGRRRKKEQIAHLLSRGNYTTKDEVPTWQYVRDRRVVAARYEVRR